MSENYRFLTVAALKCPGLVSFPIDETHHAASVLRLAVGAKIVAFDGMGRYGPAVVNEMKRDSFTAQVVEVREEPELKPNLTIACAIPKGKRLQTLVEKCVETGVDRIQPILTVRGVAKGEGSPDKWRRWIIEAAKQCRRARLPSITSPITLGAALCEAKDSGSDIRFADRAGQGEPSLSCGHAWVFIGPEGGFADGELAAMRHAGAAPFKLGPLIMRIETAAVAACVLIRRNASF